MFGMPKGMGHLTEWPWPKLLWSAEPPLQEERGLASKSQFAAQRHGDEAIPLAPTPTRLGLTSD
jgi:hypothetical protein